MTAFTQRTKARRASTVLVGALTITLTIGLLIGCSEEPPPGAPPEPAAQDMGAVEPPSTSARPPAAIPEPEAAPATPEEWASLEERIQVIEEIPFGDDDGPTAVKRLQPWLDDPDLDVREATVMALASIDGEEASRALAEHLRVERDSMIKVDMVDELVDREAPETLDALLFLLGDPDAEVRERAADGLDELADPRAIPGLHNALQGESDEYVRDAILFALATLDPDFDEDAWDEEE